MRAELPHRHSDRVLTLPIAAQDVTLVVCVFVYLYVCFTVHGKNAFSVEKKAYLIVVPGDRLWHKVTGMKAAEDHHDLTITAISAETTLPGVTSAVHPVITTAGACLFLSGHVVLCGV